MRERKTKALAPPPVTGGLTDRVDQTRLAPLRSPDEARGMALANLGMIVTIATRMGLRDPNYDLIARGWFGLYRAAQLYDPESGYQFSTYADQWIRQTLSRDLDTRAMIHVPHYVMTAIRRRRRGLTVTLPAEYLDDGERALAVARDDAEDLSRSHLADVSDRNPGPPEQAVRNEEDAAREAERAELARRLALLPPRHRKVIELRYGLADGRQWLFKDIAPAVGVTTRERVRQIESEALHVLAGRPPGVTRAGPPGPVKPGEKWCRGCQRAKAFAEFNKYVSGPGGLTYRCRSCLARQRKAWVLRRE